MILSGFELIRKKKYRIVFIVWYCVKRYTENIAKFIDDPKLRLRPKYNSLKQNLDKMNDKSKYPYRTDNEKYSRKARNPGKVKNTKFH